MTHSSNDPPLKVSTDGTAGKYITLPVSQVEAVRAALRAAGVPHTYTPGADGRVDGQSAVAVIELGKDADVSASQAVLDGLS